MAKGKWFTVSATLDGKKVWIAARKKNKDFSDTEANREYAGGFCTDRKAVEALRDYLNAKEAEA